MRVEARLHHRHAGGPVEVVRDVFFTRPQQLHPAAVGFTPRRARLGPCSHFQAPAEAAAEVGHVRSRPRRTAATFAAIARAMPGTWVGAGTVDLAALELGGAVDRLHRRVREVGRAVHRFEMARRILLRYLEIAAAVEAETAAVLGGRRATASSEAMMALVSSTPAGAASPFDVERPGVVEVDGEGEDEAGQVGDDGLGDDLAADHRVDPLERGRAEVVDPEQRLDRHVVVEEPEAGQVADRPADRHLADGRRAGDADRGARAASAEDAELADGLGHGEVLRRR